MNKEFLILLILPLNDVRQPYLEIICRVRESHVIRRDEGTIVHGKLKYTGMQAALAYTEVLTWFSRISNHVRVLLEVLSCQAIWLVLFSPLTKNYLTPPFSQPFKILPIFRGTWKLITVFVSVPMVSILGQMNPVHIAHTTSPRSILISYSHLYLDLLISLFPAIFTTETLHALLSSPMRAICPAHPIILDLIILILYGEKCK